MKALEHENIIRKSYFVYAFMLLCSFVFMFFGLFSAHAQNEDELRSKISERNTEIQKIEDEINKLESQITAVGKEAQTLESALKQLDLTDKKLTADIRLTEQRIKKANETITTLGTLIVDKEKRIAAGDAALGEALRNVQELDSRSIIEIMFGEIGFSGFWNSVQGLQQFQSEVHERVDALQELKVVHEEAKETSIKEKVKLVSFNARLADQKEIVRQNKANQKTLLAQTKNQESNYKKLRAERQEKREILENELREFESQLNIDIAPGSLPKTGKGILRWPLSAVTITQYFGNTPFASANPQVYSNKGHNGIDLRASLGTIVMSSGNGVVVETGNTDLVRGCYSYGKWVLIRHYNGLSTLYAHLSLIRVTAGQEVSVGEIIGYTGNTGYSTGPHLHFTVYATDAVKVMRLGDIKQITNCSGAKIPVSSTNGYLNPLSYL